MRGAQDNTRAAFRDLSIRNEDKLSTRSQWHIAPRLQPAGANQPLAPRACLGQKRAPPRVAGLELTPLPHDAIGPIGAPVLPAATPKGSAPYRSGQASWRK